VNNSEREIIFPIRFEAFSGGSVNLTAAASTDSETGEILTIGNRRGALTLYILPDVNSGVAADLTIDVRFQPAQESGSNYYTPAGSDWQEVEVIAAADVVDGRGILIALAQKTWWSHFERIQFRFSMASGTYNIDFSVYLEGQ